MEPTTNPQAMENPGVAMPEGNGVSAVPVAPVTTTETIAPAAPAAPANPETTAPVAPAVDSVATTPTPVAPVVTPSAPEPTPEPALPTAEELGLTDKDALAAEEKMGTDGLPLTEPIMRPDLSEAPDPVKEELESPMVAAAPVPGSIGSAVSVPESGVVSTSAPQNATPAKPTPNVSFSDPSLQPPQLGIVQATPDVQQNKKKKGFSLKFDLKSVNRNTLVALVVVAVMIVIALIAVLIMTIMS